MVSLTELKKQLAREQKKLRETQERKQISKKLDMLKNPGKFKFQEAAKRTGRGFAKISKQIGRGALRLSKKAIDEERKRQEAEVAVVRKQLKTSGTTPKVLPKRKLRRKSKGKVRKTKTKKVIIKTRTTSTRPIKRRRPQEDNSFGAGGDLMDFSL